MSNQFEENILTILEVNCTTGEQVVRPMTEEELEQHKIDAEAAAASEAAILAEEEAKVAAKSSAIVKLTALGLTEEEALAIIGG